MGSIAKRVKRAEERLSLDQGLIIINVVLFGGEPVPPEERRGNIVSRFVAYEAVQTRLKGGSGHEH